MATVRIEMDNEQVITLAASIATCILMGLEQHLPPKSALGSRIKKVEEAIVALAGMNAQNLDPKMAEVGVRAWGKTMEYVAQNIKNVKENTIAAKKEKEV